MRPATEAEEEIKKKQKLVREKIASQVRDPHPRVRTHAYSRRSATTVRTCA